MGQSQQKNFFEDFLDTAKEKSTNALRVLGNLIDRAEAAFKTHGQENRDAIIAGVKGAYDRVCKEVDIPLVSEPQESEWEQKLWVNVGEPTLNKLADLVYGPKPPPASPAA